MKRLLFFLSVVISFSSCFKEESAGTVLSSTVFQEEQSNYRVTIDMAKTYVDSCFVPTRSACSDYTILPYVGDNLDTLLYIVNYNGGGWKILSSDIRTPAIIASGETGNFNADDNPAVAWWLDCMANNMFLVRQSSDNELTFSAKEIALNKSLWTKEPVRDHSDSLLEYSGHWEYYVLSSVLDTCLVVNHLTPHWHQDPPYNEYCPLVSNNSGERAPAGCVAVAGANVLYYLHNTLGVPTQMASSGSCVGDTWSYSQSFTNPSDSVWLNMSTLCLDSSYHNRPEAIMIGYVGMLAEMHYHDTYSWALPANLRTNVYNPYGIQCSHGDYSESVVRANLSNNLPVIVTATDLLIPIDTDIHCFVIDGYMMTRTIYTCRFYWVQDSFPPVGEGGENGEMPFPGALHKPYTDLIYSQPSISLIKINWGWISQWIYGTNEGWYGLTDGWTVHCNGETYDYNHNRQMIYGFSLDE